MQASDVFAYASIIVALTLAPGPLIAIIVSRSLNRDISGALAFGVGIAAGDVLTIIMISAGLGIWMQSVPELFLLAKFGAMIYLLYIAYGMWCFSSKASDCPEILKLGWLSNFCAGTITCVATPQTILFYLLLLPRFVDVTKVGMTMVIYIALITFAAITLSFIIVVCMVRWLSFLRGPGKNQFLNRILALVIVISGFWMMS